jgi:hypothetical protein
MSNLNSLAFRSRLADLISPLRRIRPRVPFYQLAAHRIPTLWTLYRGLLRHAPGKNVRFSLFHWLIRRSGPLLAQTRFRITMLFRKHKGLTGVTETRKQLDIGHKVRSTCLSLSSSRLIRLLQWLEAFLKAKEGDTRLRSIVDRYERMIGAKREKEHWKSIIKQAYVSLSYSRAFATFSTMIIPHRPGKTGFAAAPS